LQIAITRGVSAGIAACELTHLQRQPSTSERARAQHRAYEEALERAGCRVESLPALDTCPTPFSSKTPLSCLMRSPSSPGPARSHDGRDRRHRACAGELPARDLHPGAGTLDGGDVLRIGRRIFVGQSGRSDENGSSNFGGRLPYGYTVTAVPVSGCLHLKSAVTEVAPGVVLINPAWIDPAAFGHVRVIEVDPAEPYAATVCS